MKAGPHAAFEPDVVVFAGAMDDHDYRASAGDRGRGAVEFDGAKDRTVKLDGYSPRPPSSIICSSIGRSALSPITGPRAAG